ncbi:MAG: hypothetical protein ACTHLY_02460 [Pseudolabrys sp.]
MTSFRRVAIAAVTATAVVVLTAPVSAQPLRERAHGAAICVAPGKITCAPARYAQAGDPCARKDMFGRLVRGRVAWK